MVDAFIKTNKWITTNHWLEIDSILMKIGKLVEHNKFYPQSVRLIGDKSIVIELNCAQLRNYMKTIINMPSSKLYSMYLNVRIRMIDLNEIFRMKIQKLKSENTITDEELGKDEPYSPKPITQYSVTNGSADEYDPTDSGLIPLKKQLTYVPIKKSNN